MPNSSDLYSLYRRGMYDNERDIQFEQMIADMEAIALASRRRGIRFPRVPQKILIGGEVFNTPSELVLNKIKEEHRKKNQWFQKMIGKFKRRI